jgi:TIR domain
LGVDACGVEVVPSGAPCTFWLSAASLIRIGIRWDAGVSSREVGLMVDSATPTPGRIFISYRRDETAYPAGWLYDRLADRYGGGQVFKDIDSIQLGDDFVEVITTAVGSCDVLLALVGEQWLTITDAQGRRRLDDPEDFVRLEIEAALTRHVRVIPILVDGAMMPRADELPPSLAGLVRRQALELSPARFDFDTGRLLKVLDRTLAEVRTAHDIAAWASVQARKAPDPSTTEPLAAPAPGNDVPTTKSDTSVETYDDHEYTAALAAFFTERWNAAVDLLTRVQARYPDHPQIAERLAEAQRQQQLTGWDAEARKAAEQGRWAAAVEALERIAAARPDDADIARRLQQARTQAEITGLQAHLRRMHTARQWAAVIALGQQLAKQDPRLADPDGLVTAAQAELAEVALADRYSTGLRQLDRGERAAAAETFAAIQVERPDYRDTAALLARAREHQPAQTAAEQPPPSQRVPALTTSPETVTPDQVATGEIPRPSSRRRHWLGRSALVTGGLVLAVFIYVSIAFDPTAMVLGLLALPFLVGWLLLRTRPRIGAAVTGVYAAAWSLLAISLIRNADPADTFTSLFLVLSISSALAAVVLSILVTAKPQ